MCLFVYGGTYNVEHASARLMLLFSWLCIVFV